MREKREIKLLFSKGIITKIQARGSKIQGSKEIGSRMGKHISRHKLLLMWLVLGLSSSQSFIILSIKK